MKTFIIKKGGETENPDEYIVTLTHNVSEELLKTAINILASEENIDINDTWRYLDNQFNGVDSIVKLSDLHTFYY